jgi:hypothetical protein
MKPLLRLKGNWKRSRTAPFSSALALLLRSLFLAETLVVQCPGQIILTNNTSTAIISTNSQAGLNLSGDLAPVIHQQWFWYRIGSTPQQSIDTISTPVITGLTANSAKLTYSDSLGRFSLSVNFTLSGGAPGTGLSEMAEQVTLINNASVDFHLFQYSDFDLGGPNDSLVLSRDSSTLLFNQADQSASGGELHAEAVISPGANRGEAGIVPSILAALNSGSPYALNDATNASGDVAWAWQWDAARDSLVINEDEVVNVAEISAGGVVRWGVNTAGAKQAGYFYLFQVALPPDAVAKGAAWKVNGTPDYSTDYVNWYAPTGSVVITSLQIAFRQAAGYATPPGVVTNLQSSTNFENNVQITTIPANYILQPLPQLTNVRRFADGRLAMTLMGITNRVYSFEVSSNLVNWSLVNYLTNITGALSFTNTPPTGASRGFCRVKEGSN